jgi:hypothetical protein
MINQVTVIKTNKFLLWVKHQIICLFKLGGQRVGLEFENQQQSYKMNDAVKSYINHFFKAIQNENLFEITHDYEYGYSYRLVNISIPFD